MKFSSRLKWDLRQNPLSTLLEARRRSGQPVLDLTESNPTRAGFDYPDAIAHALADARALRYDPSPRGLLSAREAVSRYYAERGRQVEPDQILLTASTSEAYSFLLKLLTDPGGLILTPRPSYPLFEFLAQLELVEVRQYPLRYDGAWHLDFADLRDAVTSLTRAIVVVNPNNPTGSFVKPDEWERLESLGLPILCDEVFSDYGFSPAAAHPQSPGVLTFSMGGLSKAAGLPQMKLGWIVAAGPGSEAALRQLELIADTYLSVATPVQLALPKLFDAAAAVRAQIQQRTRANLERLKIATAGSSAQVLNVEGGWNAVLQVPRTRTEEELSLELLSRDGVLVQPGFFFDFESEAFLVLSLLTPPDPFDEGVRCILRTI